MMPLGKAVFAVLLVSAFQWTAHAEDYRGTKLEDVVWKETIPGQPLGKLENSKPPPHGTRLNYLYRRAQRTPSNLVEHIEQLDL